jgi:hypothetical protein
MGLLAQQADSRRHSCRRMVAGASTGRDESRPRRQECLRHKRFTCPFLRSSEYGNGQTDSKL